MKLSTRCRLYQVQILTFIKHCNVVNWNFKVSAWGGYVFIINLIPLHVFVLLLMGRFSNRLFTSYTTFYILGLIFSMQIPFVGFQPIRTSEHMAASGTEVRFNEWEIFDVLLFLGVFALMFAVGFLKYLQTMMSKSEFKSLAIFGGFISAGVVFLTVVILTYAGYVAPWSGRWKIVLYMFGFISHFFVILGSILCGTQVMPKFTYQ